MNNAAFAIWFVEWTLEVFGFIRAFPRKLTPLWLLFGFLAIADLASFVIGAHSGTMTYAWAYWIVKGGKYLLLAFLSAYICGKLLNAHPMLTGILLAVLALGGGGLFAAMFSTGPTVADRLLDAGIAANMLLAGVLALAWISRQRLLREPWNYIAGGLIALMGWDCLMTFVWQFWYPARHFFWIGEVFAYGLWNYALRAELPHISLPLGVRIEAETEKGKVVQ